MSFGLLTAKMKINVRPNYLWSAATGEKQQNLF